MRLLRHVFQAFRARLVIGGRTVTHNYRARLRSINHRPINRVIRVYTSTHTHLYACMRRVCTACNKSLSRISDDRVPSYGRNGRNAERLWDERFSSGSTFERLERATRTRGVREMDNIDISTDIGRYRVSSPYALAVMRAKGTRWKPNGGRSKNEGIRKTDDRCLFGGVWG